MTQNRLLAGLFLVSICVALARCGATTSSTTSPVVVGQAACFNTTAGGSFTSASGSGSNSMTVSVGTGAICSNAINSPCTSVTICTPGNTAQCQTISDILVDTGSYGLRIFSQAMSQNLCSSLTQVTSGGEPVGECAQFGSLAAWGPIMTASVQLAGETPVQMPIQIINQAFSYVPSQCASGVVAPTGSGANFNGILGVGVFKYDCSDVGTCPSSANIYFGCQGTSCSSISMPEASQVPNPIGQLLADNNGLLFDFSSFSGEDNLTYTGTVNLGVGTQGNNTPSSTTVYSAGNFGHLNFPTYRATTVYGGGTTFSYGVVDSVNPQLSSFSFIDSGTNVLLFPAADAGIPDCSDIPGYMCPSSTVNYSATVQGETCGGAQGYNCSLTGSTGTNNFQVESVDTLIQNNGNDTALANIGADSSGGTSIPNTLFIWGLPFFYGKKIYVGLDGTTATINASTQTGPYWSY